MTEHPHEFQDTDPATMKIWLQMLREKPAGEKLAAALGLTALAMELARGGERLQHPHATEREIFLRAASRWLDPDTMVRAYGWDPRANGLTG